MNSTLEGSQLYTLMWEMSSLDHSVYLQTLQRMSLPFLEGYERWLLRSRFVHKADPTSVRALNHELKRVRSTIRYKRSKLLQEQAS